SESTGPRRVFATGRTTTPLTTAVPIPGGGSARRCRGRLPVMGSARRASPATGGMMHEADLRCGWTRDILPRVGDSRCGEEVPGRLSAGRTRLHRQVRGKRLADSALELRAREEGAERDCDAPRPDEWRA